MIYLSNSELSQFWKKKNLIFPPSLGYEEKWQIWYCHHFPYWLLTKCNPPHEIIILLHTMEKLIISLECWFQPHRGDLLPYVFFFLIFMDFYCSHVSTPLTLQFWFFFLLLKICRFSLREKQCCFCVFDGLTETINMNNSNMISHFWQCSICK